MDNLLKQAQSVGSQAVSSVGNLLSGAEQAVASAFAPKPISPLPQAQTMPQAQPSGLQGLLSSLPQETMNALNLIGHDTQQVASQGVQTVEGLMANVGKAIGNVTNNGIKDVQGYFNPQNVGSAGNPTPNFWTTPVAQALGAVQQFDQNAPRFDFSQTMTQGIQNPVQKFLAQTALGIPENLLNTPSDILRAGSQLGTDFRTGQLSQPGTAIRDVAAAALPIANIATLGGGAVAKDIAESVGKEAGYDALGQAVKEGAITGAKYGGMFGVGQGLASSNDIPTQFAHAVQQGLMGAGMGTVIGGITGGISNRVGAIKEAMDRTPQVDAQLRDLQGRWVAGNSPVKPKGMTNSQWDFQLEFNKRYNRNPYTPVMPSDLGQALNYEVGKRGIGLSIRDVNQDENPLGTPLEEQAKPSIKDMLQQPPEPPRMSSKAIREGIEVPTKGSDISVSPQAAKRFKLSGQEPEDFREMMQRLDTERARESLPPRDEANIQPGMGNRSPKEPKVPIDEGSNNLWNRFMNPLRNLPKAIQDATEKWKAGQDSAQVAANNVNLKLKAMVDQLGITPKQEWALVNYSQNPTPEFLARLQKAGYDINPELIDKAKPLLDLHRQLEDQRFNRANNAGIATQYKQNHLYQDYLESSDEINKRIEGRGLNKKPGFTFQRKIPTYLDATEQLALQPKYSTFGQINANAEHELGKSIANKNYAEFLKDNNRIVPSSQAPRGWKPILSDNFPRDPKTQETYYASPKDAEVINNIFGGQQKTPVQQLLQFTGNLSEKLQSLKLTTPGLSIHGFSVANIVRDQATALGDLVTGHPIRAMRTSGSGIMSALRAFIPGAAENFERDHAYSIKQMAESGLGYSGKQDYRTMQENVGAKLSTKILDSGKNIENMIVTDPTFRKFMFQRKVSLFENFRDSLQSQGYSPEDAAKTAAKQLQSYDGVVNDLGRSPDVKNFLRTFFFAPKYRESIVGAQINAVKGFLNPANKDYDFSRRLGLGMGMAFLAYNALNMKFTGKPMWQNPAGHEFDLAIPDPNNKTKNFYIPFMPGTTAVPRAVAGTGIALAQGDTDTAGKSFSGLLSSPIQTGIEAFGTKQDYFGRPLFDNTKPLLPQQLGYTMANTLLPASLNEVGTAITQAKQGKLNLPIEAARVLQLPIKEGTIPNPFFAARDNQLKTLPLQMQQAYGALQAVSHLDPNDPRRKQVESTLYQAYPQLFEVNKKANIAAAQGDMSKVDPLYASPAAKAYLEYQQLDSTAPGSAEEKQYLKNHPEVLQLIQDRQAYFAKNPIPQKPGAIAYMPAPQASATVQQLLAAKNYTNPQVQQYLSQHLDYINQERAKLGLDPLDQYGNIQGSKNYGGGAVSSSMTAALKRNIMRESRYSEKSGWGKVMSAFQKAGNQGVEYHKAPKMKMPMATRPIGNKKTIAVLPKHGKTYKAHSVGSLMSYKAPTPRFKPMQLPKRLTPKNIFLA